MELVDILFGYFATQCLHTAVKLKIADQLADDELAIELLADRVACDTERLYRVLRYLASRGVFIELPNRQFKNNQLSQGLRQNEPGSLAALVELHADYFYSAAAKIPEAVAKAAQPFALAFNMPAYQYFLENDSVRACYDSAMQGQSELLSQLIVKSYDFSRYRQVVDLGGGLGALLVAVLKAVPEASGVNLDLAKLQPLAEEYFKAQGVSERCQFAPGDFYTAIPGGADLYLMKAILHGKPRAQALDLLVKLRDSMPEQARLLVIDHLIDPQSPGYPQACAHDMHLLNVTGGADKTLAEYQQWFVAAGFDLLSHQSVHRSLHLMELQPRSKLAG